MTSQKNHPSPPDPDKAGASSPSSPPPSPVPDSHAPTPSAPEAPRPPFRVEPPSSLPPSPPDVLASVSPTPGGRLSASPEEAAGHLPAAVASRPGVLVVDDSEWNRELTLTMLSRLNVPLFGAACAKEALAMLETHHPSVVVSDWMMPDMDGLALCKAVRQCPSLHPTHFLLLTARSAPEDLLAAFEAGVDDYLSKPVRASELLARVQVGLRINALYRETHLHRRQAEVHADQLRKTEKRLREALDRLDAQIREIAELQTSFLPARLPSVGGLSFAALCRPSREVGGDYYDAFELPDGRVCLVIADVTGHGARAAVCMAMTRSLTRAIATLAQPTDGPAWLLTHINGWLCDQLADHQFVTMWLGLWNPETAELRYSRAGHPAGILYRAGNEPEELSLDGTAPLGIFPYKDTPPEDTLQLEPLDRLFLYTDGWTEATNAKGEFLGTAGFIESLEETDGLALESVPLALFFQLERFAANSALIDDVSLLILERHDSEAS